MIDWGICAVGPPEAGVARTLALMRFGRPFEEKPGIRVPAQFFRRLSVAFYLRVYRRMNARPTLLSRWFVVRAIENLGFVLALGPKEERASGCSSAWKRWLLTRSGERPLNSVLRWPFFPTPLAGT